MGGITRVGRPHQPTEGGGIHHPPRCRPVEPDASIGARPVRRRLIGVILVRSARRDVARHARVIPVFYPIERSSRREENRGDGEIPRAIQRNCPGPWWTKRVKIPPEGSGPLSVRSTRAGVGSFWPGDRRNRLFDRSRGPSANPRAAKSSTMKGPQGLASHSDRGRCRTANASHRGISGRF